MRSVLLLIVIVSAMGLIAGTADAGVGRGYSGQFTIVVDAPTETIYLNSPYSPQFACLVDPPSDVVYVNAPLSPQLAVVVDPPSHELLLTSIYSPQFAVITNLVARDFSDIFSLNTGQWLVDPAWYHLGDDPQPPCGAGDAIAAGNQLVIGFPINSQALALYRTYGAVLHFQCRHVIEPLQTQVAVNQHLLPALPSIPGCSYAGYSFPISDFLISGDNNLTVSLIGSGDLSDLLIGEFWIISGSAGLGDLDIQVLPALGDVTLNISLDGEPFDGVRAELYRAGQMIRAAQPQQGSVVFTDLIDGSYEYRIREGHQGGEVLATGDFVIDLSNQPPVITTAEADPPSIGNDGTGQLVFSVTATDPDGTVTSVTLDLRQIGGELSHALAHQGDDLWSGVYTVPALTSPATYNLPVAVGDNRGAFGTGQITLAVMPAAGWDSETLQVCGFTLQASSVVQTGGTSYSVSGDVLLTHNSGLPLMLAGSGSLAVELSAPQSITAQGQWTMRANLGDLGVYDLFQGEFAIGAEGELSINSAANYLLSEIAGFTRDDNGDVDLVLLLGADPGIRVTARCVFDAVDGIMGNGLPVAYIEAELRLSGAVSGSAWSDDGALSWNLQAGTISATSVGFANRTLTISDATFTFKPGTFDFDSRMSVSVPTLVVGPEGIKADGVVIDDFDFRYGGFQFLVEEAKFTNASFQAVQTQAVFPLPSGPATVSVRDILVDASGLSIAGGSLRIPPLKIGTYDLAGVYGEFAKEGDRLYIAAEGGLSIPGFADVVISFQLDSQCTYLLKEFCMALGFSGRGVPIGNTGFLLTDIGGCILDEQCTNNWLITFTAGLASADYVDPPGLSLIQANVGMALSPQPFRIGASGTVLLVGQFLGAAGFDLYTDRFEGYGNIEIPPAVPYLVARAGLEIRWQPQFYFLGTAEGVFQIPIGELPAVIRGLFGGENITLANFGAQIDRSEVSGVFAVPSEENAIADVRASYTWASNKFHFSANLDWGWPWLHFESETARRQGVRSYRRYELHERGGPLAAAGVYHGDRGSLQQVLQRQSALSFTDSITTLPVPENAPPLVAILNMLPPGGDSELTFTLTTPSAVTVDSTYCAQTPGFTYVRGPDAIGYLVEEPEAGSWQMTVGNIKPGQEYELDAFYRNREPQFSWVTPLSNQSLNTSDALEIGWHIEDPDDDATFVSLYAIAADRSGLRDGEDGGPWLIASDLPDTVSAYTWVPATMRTGEYRLVAEARDVFGKSFRDTSNAVISLTNVDKPLAPSGVRVLAGPERLRVMWNSLNRSDLKGYRVFYRLQGADQPDTFDVGLKTQHLLSSLADDEAYEIWVEGYDVMEQAGPTSSTVIATPTALGDVEPPAIPGNLDVSFDIEANRATLTWDQVDDAVAYRIHYDIDIIGAYQGVGAVEGDSPILQGRTGQVTLTGLTQGRRYFLAVSAMDAAGNESYQSDPVPLLVSSFVDTDGDGLPDDWEMMYLGTLDYGPHDDPDGDGLDNYTECFITFTHPGLADTDGDRVPDGVDPNPLCARDSSGNGLPDDWQWYWGVTDADGDPDEDGLSNLLEFLHGGSPWDPDTDGDGLSDYYEVFVSGTSVWKPDTDGGGMPDGLEVALGLDPLDPRDDFDYDPTSVDDGSVPLATRLLSPLPNPFNAELVVPFELARGGRITVEIYDIKGRLVRKVIDEHRLAGRYAERWDGRDGSGRGVASGVYFVRFRGDGIDSLKKVALIK